MRRLTRHVVRIAALGLVAVGGLTATASPAAAAYTPEGLCGSSYYRLSSVALKTNSGYVWGTTYVLYSASTRKNCAVTIKSAHVGVPTKTTVRLEDQSGELGYDSDSYRWYAGPVYVTAPNECITYGGYVYNGAGTTYAYGSRWYVHCG
ncbi:hypothetical protein ACTMTJ_09345 [Phytohabitans sp. LJ34]|uniref:hypothetical protein n=1 Tax=Phytohabitans sp. LJ34 TaxID=3452217 RepID=UPI003F8948BE